MEEDSVSENENGNHGSPPNIDRTYFASSLAKFNPLYAFILGGASTVICGYFMDHPKALLSPFVIIFLIMLGVSGSVMMSLRARLISPDGFIQPYGFDEEAAAKRSAQPALWMCFFLARIVTVLCAGGLSGWTVLMARQLWG